MLPNVSKGAFALCDIAAVGGCCTLPSHISLSLLQGHVGDQVACRHRTATHALTQVPLPATVALATIDVASVFILSYTVAPTILSAAHQPSWYGTLRVHGGSGQFPVPLQCGGKLRPEHSALLSCRPLAQQVLLGLAMVA